MCKLSYVYVPFYRICSDSQSSLCHNEGVDDVNKKIELDHNIEGMEKVLNLPREILEALNRESEESKHNIEETEVINLAEEGKKGVNFPKDMKDKLIALLKVYTFRPLKTQLD